HRVIFAGSGCEARILGVDAEPPAPGETAKEDLVKLQVALAPDAAPGRHEFRVVTSRGVSGPMPLQVTADPVLREAPPAPLRRFPVVINGRIAQPGQTDSYWIEAAAGETFTFEAASFAGGFDPSVAIYEPSGSWFDPHRLNLLAANDEPLSFPDLSTDARLAHRFARAGKYCVRVQGFTGQGSPDSVYQLRIVRGETPAPSLHPTLKANWEERQFTRALSNNRMEELARRGGAPAKAGPIEVFRATSTPHDIPVMTAPGIVEGRIDRSGVAHLIRLKIDKPQ